MTTSIATREFPPELPEGLCHCQMVSLRLCQDFGLSSRETGVLQLVTDGLADKEIALALGISRFTVNKHVRAIMRKIDAGSRTEAAVRALRAGLVS